MISLVLCLTLLVGVTSAGVCPDNDAISLGTDPTGSPPICETVDTGACAAVFGADTACVEKPPSDQTWSAQQYMDLMTIFDTPAVMGMVMKVNNRPFIFVVLLDFFPS